jgi:hypothetical protein
MISQNGNAGEEGLSEAWNSARAYWKEPSEPNRGGIWVLAEPQATVWQYAHGVPDKTQVSPDGCELDCYYSLGGTPSCLPAGAGTFKRGIPDADVRFVPTGDLALDARRGDRGSDRRVPRPAAAARKE